MDLAEAVAQFQSSGYAGNLMGFGEALARSDRWRSIVEDIAEPDIRRNTAIMLHNTHRYLYEALDETTRAVQIGDFEKFAFPLVRAIFPELIAQRLFSVQPMMGPVSLVFYLAFTYATNKGNVSLGSTAFDPVGLGANNPAYTSPTVNGENWGTGSGSQPTDYTGTAAFVPIQPTTLMVQSLGVDGQYAIDDGNGAIVGDATGTINYGTGAYSITFNALVTTGAVLSATYDYNMEANGNLPEIDMNLTSAPVMARPRKLRAKWSLEAAFNLRSLHGLDADVELTNAIGSEIRFETDRELINTVAAAVPSANLAPAWSKTLRFKDTDSYSSATGATDTVGLNEHNLSLINQFVTASNKIFTSTGRAIGTWVVAGVEVCNILETLPNYIVNQVPSGLVKGPYLAGRLGSRWDIYKDPFFGGPAGLYGGSSGWFMGYRGTSMLETGFVYAPYIPLYTTPTITLDDFINRKAMASQYGTKLINNLFYSKGQIVA
jgi:hypothetical protein